MKKPSNFHLVVVFLEIFGEKHEVVVMAPNNIALLIVIVHNVREHPVGLLIRFELRLKTPRGCKTVLLWEAEIVEQGPQYIVAVAVVILIDDLFVEEYRNTLLQRHPIHQKTPNIQETR